MKAVFFLIMLLCYVLHVLVLFGVQVCFGVVLLFLPVFTCLPQLHLCAVCVVVRARACLRGSVPIGVRQALCPCVLEPALPSALSHFQLHLQRAKWRFWSRNETRSSTILTTFHLKYFYRSQLGRGGGDKRHHIQAHSSGLPCLWQNSE